MSLSSSGQAPKASARRAVRLSAVIAQLLGCCSMLVPARSLCHSVSIQSVLRLEASRCWKSGPRETKTHVTCCVSTSHNRGTSAPPRTEPLHQPLQPQPRSTSLHRQLWQQPLPHHTKHDTAREELHPLRPFRLVLSLRNNGEPNARRCHGQVGTTAPFPRFPASRLPSACLGTLLSRQWRCELGNSPALHALSL